MQYQKPPLTYIEQLDLLRSRGLHVENKESAIKYLRQISYYRLSAYFLPFKRSGKFHTGTTIENVLKLYFFDQKLRLLVLSAIEPIEIAFRTQVIYHLSHKYGIFGYLESTNFSNRFNHEKWLNKINTDSEWSQNLKLLVKEYSEISLTSMGFPSNWINEKIWI
jgi:abortive infection bacteriophage resistance protein